MTLYANAMIASFVLDHNSTCALCSGARLLPFPRETLAHILVGCPMISKILSELNKLISNNALYLGELKIVIWLGALEKNFYSVFKTSLIVVLTNFHIYKSRKTLGTPSLSKYNSFLLAYTLQRVFSNIPNE